MTDETIHHAVADLLGAYALDAVDPSEAALVESHLEDCALCRDEVSRHRAVAAHLAHSYEDPPAGLWDRIAADISSDGAPLELVIPPSLYPRRIDPGAGDDDGPEIVATRKGLPNPQVMLVVAAAIVLVVVISGITLVQQYRISDLKDPSLADTAQTVMSDPDSDRVDLVGEGVEVAAVLSSSGQGYLFGDDLPALPEGRAYQLWSVAGDAAVSLGVLGDDPDVVAFTVPIGAEAIAITDEPATGVAQPSQDPLAVGALPT